MAYNPNRLPSGPHRSTPLIARPSANAQPSHPIAGAAPGAHGAHSYLGNMLGGALAGMGYPASLPAHPHSAQYPAAHPLPMSPSFVYPYPSMQSYQNSQTYPQSYPSTSSLPARPLHPSLPAAPARPPSNPAAGSNRKPQAAPPRPTEFKCQLETCTFSHRSRRIVREHEEDRHLIFEPGREPKPWSGSLKPLEGAVIEGTGISLDTPEAVAKWIADRKKRWPTRKLVEEKEKAREERIKAGLEQAPRPRHSFASSTTRETSRDARMGQHRGANDEPARKKFKRDDGSAANSSDSSSESSSDSDSDDDDDEGPERITKVSKDSLKALVGPDDCDPSDDEDSEEEGDEPVEEATSKRPNNLDQRSKEVTEPTAKQYQVVCRHWRRGQCALGDSKCPYLHTIPADQPLPAPRRNRPQPRGPTHNPFSGAFQRDPFQLLQDQEMKHVVSDLLQTIDFLKANHWLDRVELRVGQLDEESGIEVLEPPRDQVMVQEERQPAEEEDEDKGQEEELLVAPVAIEILDEVQPPMKGFGGLVADYASTDEDDDSDQVEQQVKQSLLPSRTPSAL
ncbi:uncharacterized protein JCM15063_003478 [Sporobolomyces koalae]|uniref:uncharacterized protein n=1 Tax=Sporobolomyces koalae TaxID=500713 RepID=UPI00316F46A9